MKFLLILFILFLVKNIKSDNDDNASDIRGSTIISTSTEPITTKPTSNNITLSINNTKGISSPTIDVQSDLRNLTGGTQSNPNDHNINVKGVSSSPGHGPHAPDSQDEPSYPERPHTSHRPLRPPPVDYSSLHAPEERPPESQHGVLVPIYAIYLIGFSMLLLFIIIMYLVYALQKAKGSDYRIFTSHTNPTSISFGKNGFSRQVSAETTKPAPAQLEEIIVDDSIFKHASSIRDIRRNDTTSSINNSGRRDSRVIPIIKKSMHSNLILPEQMRQICEGVLKNPLAMTYRSTRDLNELLNDVEILERHPSGAKRCLAREKSASTPELDIYDTLPVLGLNKSTLNIITSPKETKESEISKQETKLEKASEGKGSTENIDDSNDDIDDIPLYDSPPIAKGGCDKTTVVVEDAQYLLVLDSAPKSPKERVEPSYINAKKNDFLI